MSNKNKMHQYNNQYRPTVLDLFNRPLCDIDFFGNERRAAQDNALTLSTDVLDKGDHYQLKTDMPGIKKEDIKVDFNDGVLTISAERKFEKNENGKDGFIMHERTEGTYSRSFKFEDVDPEGINAAFANGELDISLKKAAKSQGKQISIN
ncbi:MAG: Hsp20/alpha crystallin family protein [Succinatimonas sp.]|nr:Hsp20/alpha crystallin family protein [Succinatimonas sp.]